MRDRQTDGQTDRQAERESPHSVQRSNRVSQKSERSGKEDGDAKRQESKCFSWVQLGWDCSVRSTLYTRIGERQTACA